MLTRLSIFASFLIAALVLLPTGHFTIAKWLFAFSGLSALEAVMFRYYAFSRLNIKIGKAEDAELIKGDDTNNQECLCVPISLRVAWWEVKGISFTVKSIIESNSHLANSSELFNRRGISLENFDGTSTLDWRIKRGFASLAFLVGKSVCIGSPIPPRRIPLQESYLIALEVWHSDNLIDDSWYILNIIDDKMLLSDVK